MKKIFLKPIIWILRFSATTILRVKKPQIIGITGSVAKSSTKEAIYAVLRQKFTSKQVCRSVGNLNTEIGVPLAILGFKTAPPAWFLPIVAIFAFFKVFYLLIVPFPKILILEMAADKPGDIKYLTSFIKPQISIVTAIGPAHLETFKSVENVAKEKSNIVKVINKVGYALLNKDDVFVASMSKITQAKVIFFQPKDYDIAHSAAKKVGEIFGLSSKEIEEGLKKIVPLSGRMNLQNGKKDSLILSDTYNANPLSMSFALHRLAELAKTYQKKRKIAVLGDMLELGDYFEKGHRQVGKEASKIADLVICTGLGGEIIAKTSNGKYFDSKQELINYLLHIIQKDDIILLKASRKMAFEDITNVLKG